MTETDSYLLGCPCCGSGATSLESHSSKGQDCSQRHGYQVRCMACGLQTCWWRHAAEAASAWNTRAQGWAHSHCVIHSNGHREIADTEVSQLTRQTGGAK